MFVLYSLHTQAPEVLKNKQYHSNVSIHTYTCVLCMYVLVYPCIFEHQDCNYAHVYIHMYICCCVIFFLICFFFCSCTLYMYIQLYTSCHVFLFNMYMLCVHLTNLSPPLSPSLSASLPPPSISLSLVRLISGDLV